MLSKRIDDIVGRLQELQAELETEIEKLLDEKREQFRYTLERGKVHFEEGVHALQRRHKMGVWNYLRTAQIGHVLSAPLLYSLIVPFVILDTCVSIYQHICFRIYGIPRVDRLEYLVVDHQQLAYLNAIEKVNCVYCGYANGLFAYAREVGARTEQYWCPIKHARRVPDPHRLVDRFVDYGDADAYRVRLDNLRREIRSCREEGSQATDSDKHQNTHKTPPS